MHIPKLFELKSTEAIARILREHRFGLLVTTDAAGAPNATPLPFVYEGDGSGGRLLAHVSAANPQADELRRMAANGQPALAVFQGPHNYASPTWYGAGHHPPTWNYVAVHISGVPDIVEDPAEVDDMLARMTAQEEARREPSWVPENLPMEVRDKLRPALLAFTMPLTKVEAKAKLGQNKPAAARDGLRAGLKAEGTAEADALLAWMEALDAEAV
jgi:transcriptional regulator